MKLKSLARECFGGLGCPQVFKDEESGDVVIVGKKLSDVDKNIISNLQADEDVVLISSALFREAHNGL